MKQKWVGFVVLAPLLGLLLSFSGCGHNQHLVSITLQPTGGFVFEGPGAQGQFTAIGTYEHPPATRDISNQVVWALNIANFGTLTQTGQITYTRTDGCGSGDVTATFNDNPSNPKSGNVMVGSAPVKGVNDGTSKCGGGGSSNNLSVSITAGSADGVVISSPAGINCGTTCSAAFPTGSFVALTAGPNAGNTFLGWASGCTSVTGNGITCNVTLNTDVTVTGSFN